MRGLLVAAYFFGRGSDRGDRGDDPVAARAGAQPFGAA